MVLAADLRVQSCPGVPPPGVSNLHARVLAEYREMPGLTLTLPQAARLFGLELAQCEQVLRTLVAAGELATDGRSFVCASGGRRSLQDAPRTNLSRTRLT